MTLQLDQIPPLAWVAILFIVLLTIIINFSLITFLRNRDHMDEFAQRMKERRSTRTTQSMQKLIDVARHPFGEEQKQLDELSDLVSRLKSPPGAAEEKEPAPPKDDPKQK